MNHPLSNEVCTGLVTINEALEDAGLELSGGFLGGRYGYGAPYKSPVFDMQPFCWCEKADCPWCLVCSCPETAFRDAEGNMVSAEQYWQMPEPQAEEFSSVPLAPGEQCTNCVDGAVPAPNFRHHESGIEVRWYKYIGRDMQIDGLETAEQWQRVVDECVEQIREGLNQGAHEKGIRPQPANQ